MMEDGGMSKISNQSFGVFFSFVLHSAIFLRPSASHICYMCTLNASPDLRQVFTCGLQDAGLGTVGSLLLLLLSKKVEKEG